MTVQNFETLFLECDSTKDFIFLPKDRFLENRKISYIYPFFASGNTFNGISIFDREIVKSCYIDIYNKDKGCICSKQNLTVFCEYMKHTINDVLDLDLTKINVKSLPETNGYIALCVVYATMMDKPELLATNSLTLSVSSLGNKIIKLSEIGGYQLHGKQIRQIQCTYPHNAYLTIRTVDNKNNIYNIPLALLDFDHQLNDNCIKFDGLNIDSDNSFIRIEDGSDIYLTFKY